MKRPASKWFFYACLVLSGFAIAVIVYLITTRIGGSSGTFKGIFTALQPILVGIIMTYLLYPLANNCELLLLQKKVNQKLTRLISVAVAAVFVVALFFLFGYLILPQLISSIINLSGNLQDMTNTFIAGASGLLERYGQPATLLADSLQSAIDAFSEWFKYDLVNTLMNIATGLFNVAKVAINLVIGIIVMIYMLISRDHFIGQSKKILYAVCGNRRLCSNILDHVRQINRIFGGFLTGKVIDSLIIGVLCFIGLSVLQIPYPLLISVIVGVTNVIPVFGPIIGAVPSAFLLLLTDPTKCLVFVIFIIILQQLDGNVIGPMILGDSTGLPAFWVLFSLLLFQHLMGFWGMIVGVPLFASIYYLVKQLVNYLLAKRNLPLLTSDYVRIDRINEEGELRYLEKKSIKSFFRLKKKKGTGEQESQETTTEKEPKE